MARSSDTFNKQENEKKKAQKRKEKEQKKEERKSKESKSFEDMIMYVDENGNFTSTPPDLTKKRVIKESDIDLSSKNKGGAGADPVRKGFVKFFEKEKGYGFIKDSDTQEEYFFHYSSANFPIAQSQAVSFELEQGPKGLNAVRISKAE